jgi:SulP family sulfate permease
MSTAVSQAIGSSLYARLRRLLSACVAAVSSTAAHAPENAAYGLMAMAALGAAFGPTAMGLALLGAAVASGVASVLGGGRLAGDAGAALALLTTGMVAALARELPAGTPDAAWSVLALLAIGIAGAGLLQVVYGLLDVGELVKFTPYPVRAGMGTGIGLLLIGGAAPALAGHAFASGWPEQGAVKTGAVLIGVIAVVATAWAYRARTAVPPLLLGLVGATLAQAAARVAGWDAALGPLVGVPRLPDGWFASGASPALVFDALARPSVLMLLAGYALTASIIASLDALLAASIVDGRLRRSRDPNRELIAQGLGNLASAAVGGLPASPSVPASLGLVTQQPQQRHIALAYAAVLLGVLLLAPRLLGLLPASAVAGVLVYLGASMISSTLWRTPVTLWHLGREHRQHRGRHQGPLLRDRRFRMLVANWAVTLLVALGAVGLGLGPAVLIGASCAVLLFVRANMRDVVRRAWSGEHRQSLKTRPPHLAEALRRHGRGIVVLELQGALFFGTADALRQRLEAHAAQAETVILDLHQVSEIDVTAARILCETAADWERMGRPIVFTEWPAHDPRRGLLESLARDSGTPALRFEEHADRALEHAEEQLLHGLQIERHAGAALQLADTTMARGLSDAELAVLASEMTAHDFPRGHVLFRVGDPGDRLYVSLHGEIGLRMPGSERRLASFAPGVSIGELAVLALQPRSAEAVAESDVTALGLSVDAFERMMQAHPTLAAKLLRNMALQLGDRVRALTGDLAGWVQRTGAGRP